MTAIIRFMPLYGADNDGVRELTLNFHLKFALQMAVCSVLEVDEYTILLDCGWDYRFDPSLLAPLQK